MRVEGLIIDPQIDFCDPAGNLFVTGAVEDMIRLSAMVTRLGDRVADYHVTLDSHQDVHIAHPHFWRDSNGSKPAPFTIIGSADLKSGAYTTAGPKNYRWAEKYITSLEQSGRYPLCVWPVHCVVGSGGYCIVPVLHNALREWAVGVKGTLDLVTKGSNPFTEHYSAVKAEVPMPNDPSTQINKNLIDTLQKADLVFIAGQALSHCVANTIRDIANEFGDDSYVKKLVLLTDATSSVPGFEQWGIDFIKEMIARGMQTSTTVDFLR